MSALNLHVVRLWGPWDVRSGLILLVWGHQNANGTNSGAPERRSGAFRLTLTADCIASATSAVYRFSEIRHYETTSPIQFLLYQKPVELEHIILPQLIIRRCRSLYRRILPILHVLRFYYSTQRRH